MALTGKQYSILINDLYFKSGEVSITKYGKNKKVSDKNDPFRMAPKTSFKPHTTLDEDNFTWKYQVALKKVSSRFKNPPQSNTPTVI